MHFLLFTPGLVYLTSTMGVFDFDICIQSLVIFTLTRVLHLEIAWLTVTEITIINYFPFYIMLE